MGLFDTIFGRRVRTGSDWETNERILDISSASTMLESHGMRPIESAGICFKPMSDSDFERVISDVNESMSGERGRHKYTTDEYGYHWIVVYDDEFDGLVELVHSTVKILTKNGFGERLLCAVFGFIENENRIYWVYSYKRGSFYPFVPLDKKRDMEKEVKLASLLKEEMNIEKDASCWYPIWNPPL
jgi:hypothetical protein